MSKEEPKKKTIYRGSLFFPVVLIVIGVVFLLNNLGKLSGSAWDTILLCWPLIFVIIGLDSLLRRDGAAIPTFFIGVGVILLLSNFGQLAMSGWSVLWSVWPVFLIAIGMDIMFSRRSFWLGFLAVILVVAILGGVLWYFGSNFVNDRLDVDQVAYSFSGAKQVNVSIRPLIGYLVISELVDSNDSIEGTVKHWQGEKIRQNYQIQDGTGAFDLESSGGAFIFPTSPGFSPTWDLKLTSQIPLDLKTEMVVGKSKIVAQNLSLSNLASSLVIGETTVYLPEKGKLSARLEGVIGSVVVYVPESMEVSINSEVGLLNVQVPKDFFSRGGSYFSPGYIEAQNQADLEISQVIGRVKIIKE